MSVSSLVTRGYSNGAFSGSIAYIVTAGYDISAAVVYNGYLSGDITMLSAYNGITLVESTYAGSTNILNSLDLT